MSGGPRDESIAVGRPDLARVVEHTLLAPDATYSSLERLCEEARTFSLFGVCVASAHVARCRSWIAGSHVKLVTVVGFPLGATSTRAKAIETSTAVEEGADEIDMVLSIGALKSGDREAVARDVRAVVDAAGSSPVKVILETALLTEEEKVTACLLARDAGARFVKTSTGFAAGGATVADIALMRRTVGPSIGIKASGGIRDTATADAMLAAGADRIGTSRGIALIIGEGRDSAPARRKEG